MHWFKMYSEVLNDRKIQSLPGDLLKAWLNFLCLANENPRRGFLPCIEDVAFSLRVPEAEASEMIEDLLRRGLLDRDRDGWIRPHNWDGRQGKDGTSTERVRKHRKKAREEKAKSTPTPPDPPQKTEDGNGVKRNETFQEQNETPLELELELETEKRDTKEESLSNDNNSKKAGVVVDELDEVVVDGGTFLVISDEHRKTIEHARSVVGERFAAVVADQGSSLDVGLGGRWDCYRAAIDNMIACGKRPDRPATYCRQTALGYVLHGKPRVADTPLDIGPATKPRPLTPFQARHEEQIAKMRAYVPPHLRETESS